jgi:hypothetical protein
MGVAYRKPFVDVQVPLLGFESLSCQHSHSAFAYLMNYWADLEEYEMNQSSHLMNLVPEHM